MKKEIFNAENGVFGRVGGTVAKSLLKGNSVDLINCEKMIVSGDKKFFVDKLKRKRKMGSGSSLKGPRYLRREDLLAKRMIRGMLPWDRAKGREAFKRLRCYLGDGALSEEELKESKKFSHKMPNSSFSFREIVEALK